ncbi:MAG: hypothetical protein Q9180_008440, partial [Flavoplaca navasiana]
MFALSALLVQCGFDNPTNWRMPFNWHGNAKAHPDRTTPIRWLSDDGICAIDLKLDPKRFPSGQRDTGDDAYGDSIIEAARYVLDTCVKQTNRGGRINRFSELPTPVPMTVVQYPNHPYFLPPGAFRPRTDGTATMLGTTDRLSITFSSYANKLPAIKCDPVLPLPPLNQAFKDKVHRALYALPTSDKVVTFNQTRLPGPAGTSAVLYLLPRREPAAEPSPALRIDMLGDKVVSSSMWEIWTAGVAVDTLCVQKGKQGYAFGI